MTYEAIAAVEPLHTHSTSTTPEVSLMSLTTSTDYASALAVPDESIEETQKTEPTEEVRQPAPSLATRASDSLYDEDTIRAMDAIIDNFNFDRVHRVMTFLDWKWVHRDGKYNVPSIMEMKGSVRRKMKDVMRIYKKYGHTSISSGGLQVDYSPADAEGGPYFCVSFVIEEVFSDECPAA